uniref:Secreted protein n=1 Tax=Steinernema glaseri TaxID=37863 RepID=A0A1I7YZX2_9BILA
MIVVRRSALLLLSFGVFVAVASRWTEQDEARRIAQLKEQERLEFQMEMQQQENTGFSSGDYFSGGSGAYRPPEGSSSFRSAPQSPRYSPFVERRPISRPTQHGSPPQANFCFHCASPFGVVSPDLQKALQAFLKMRRTKYPSDVVTAQCSNPKEVGS